MAILGNSITVRVQQHSSGVTNEIIAESTSVDAQFNAESLESTTQADGLVSTFEGGKNTIQVSGDYLLAVDAEQFDLLFVHANAGDKVEVDIYRGDTPFITTEGVFTSLNEAGALSDSLATGAYSMELDVMDGYGEVLNVSTCENNGVNPYDTFDNATATGFDAIFDGDGSAFCGTADEIAFVSWRKYTFSFDLTLNSGALPVIGLVTEVGGVDITSEGNGTATEGNNVHVFTVTSTTTGAGYFFNGGATNFEITNLSIKQSV